jgi:hypothetical protein
VRPLPLRALESHQGDVLRAISRRTPNADEGHLRLRRRLTEQARCAIKAPRVTDGVRRVAGGREKPAAWRSVKSISSTGEFIDSLELIISAGFP